MGLDLCTDNRVVCCYKDPQKTSLDVELAAPRIVYYVYCSRDRERDCRCLTCDLRLLRSRSYQVIYPRPVKYPWLVHEARSLEKKLAAPLGREAREGNDYPQHHNTSCVVVVN